MKAVSRISGLRYTMTHIAWVAYKFMGLLNLHYAGNEILNRILIFILYTAILFIPVLYFPDINFGPAAFVLFFFIYHDETC